MKLGVGIISLDPCDHVGTAQWLRGSVCISRTMCTNPRKTPKPLLHACSGGWVRGVQAYPPAYQQCMHMSTARIAQIDF